MQAITHFFSGIFGLALLWAFKLPDWLTFILIFPIGVGLHFIIDTLAKATYHPPDPHPDDKFWVGWHVIVFIASFIVAIVFWVPFFWGMLASILPDIYDWGFIRGIRTIKKRKLGDEYDNETEFMHGKDFHPYVESFRDKYFQWLPNWNHAKKGVIPEILIWLGCIIAVVFLV